MKRLIIVFALGLLLSGAMAQATHDLSDIGPRLAEIEYRLLKVEMALKSARN